MKIAVSLKHLSNFWISLEMPLINSKAELPLTWVKKCILSSATGAAVTAGASATFEMRDAKLYVPVVTLLTEDNVKLTKQLNDGFKRSIYGNKYKIRFNKDRVNPPNKGTYYIRELLDSNYQGVKRLFILAYDDRTNDNDTDADSRVKVDFHKRYFLPRVNIKNYNIEIDSRNFYDVTINDPIKKYDEV